MRRYCIYLRDVSVVIPNYLSQGVSICSRHVKNTTWFRYSRLFAPRSAAGAFPAPSGAEAYSEYAIASAKGLIPEMENAARQTLDHPLTFDMLGKGLECWAMRESLLTSAGVAGDNLIACLDSFVEVEPPGL